MQLTCLSQWCFVLSSLLLLLFLVVAAGPMQLLTMLLCLNDSTPNKLTQYSSASENVSALNLKQWQSRVRTDISVWNKALIILWLLDSKCLSILITKICWILFHTVFAGFAVLSQWLCLYFTVSRVIICVCVSVTYLCLYLYLQACVCLFRCSFSSPSSF